jgi:hypothetical protein
MVGTITYIRLRLEGLAHREEDLQLARGEVGSAGGGFRHVGGRVVGVWDEVVWCWCVVGVLVCGVGKVVDKVWTR